MAIELTSPVFAIVTPFNSSGDLDFSALDDYLRFLAAAGVRCIVVNGTTGEFPSLTLEERFQTLERCRKTFTGQVVAHVSACATRDCIRLLGHARDHADAALLLPPYYYARVEAAGVLAFFREVIAASRVPVYLYNFPEHTQFEIPPAMLRTLADEFEHLAGIKDSGGKIDVSQAYKQTAPRLQVMVGSDRRALEVLRLGLDGSVTGCGNPVPEFLVRLTQQHAAGRHDEADATQRAFDVFTTFREGLAIREIPLVKAALSARIPGFRPYVRPPFVTADDAALDRISAGLRECLLR